MLLSLAALALLSSPYPFEIKSGFILEPTIGYLTQDNLDKDKTTAGLRLSYFRPDITDAVIALELQALSATTLTHPSDSKGGKRFVTNTDYFYEASAVFYEIYNPVAFRLALGAGIERRHKNSFDLYYRGGLGRYFFKNFGCFADISGRMIFRSEKLAFPIELGPSLQIIF
ncbi:MAG: hypothetical protein JWQ35_1320 [Bacteriovoracaceae bacterium]|nr:hypothetical protein [Bacteriovoracaceae bacterium]